MNWKNIGKNIIELNNYYHSKTVKLTKDDRLNGIIKSFREILNKYSDKTASLYVKKRKPEDKKLKIIQEKIRKETINFLGIKDIIPVSSFTAGTNLIGISDLDYAVLVDEINENILLKYSNLFGMNGYVFKEIRQPNAIGVHYVFEKYIDNVEIEMKLRDKKYFLSTINPMHLYIDKKISKKDKETITWIKYNLKEKSKEGYKAFKALYYEYGIGMAGLKDMLYPIS